ncbi:MAG: hypothetical protein JW840_00070 [Candidatus Thermoplasmatota archaeon]|nr:hypothetical protein [Candidatus Thermoplasmatota archaeon]
MNLLLKKLYLDKKEFATSEELKHYCNKLGINYENTIRNLIARGHLIRIFKGVFYIKSLEEKELGKTTYSYHELIAHGLALKHITAWYFGLSTALKLNQMTHESFAVDHIINDTLFRARPMTIAGHSIKVYKLSRDLLTFGVKTQKNYCYSDPEKTILDFLYLWRYNGVPEERIRLDLSEYITNVSKPKLKRYAQYYPQTVRTMVEGLT